MRRSAEIALGELAGFALAPGGAGGPAGRLWALRGGGMSWRRIGERSVVYGVIFNIPYVGAALTLGIGVSLGVLPASAPPIVALAPIGLVAATVTMAAVITATSRSRWMRGSARWKRNTRALLAVVPGGIRELHWFARRPAGLAGAFGYWAFDCAALWAAIQACGGSPPLAVIVLAYMLGQLGNLLPLPGGIGGVEPLMLGIFTASGVHSGMAAAAVVCYRAISLGLQSTAGAVGVASLAPAVRRERLQAVSRSSHETRPPTAPAPDARLPASPASGARI